ncbi:hypothetical protein WALSEDRAFT_39936 [Wallemia mellicola CBS 633.66]|uniref:Uncharacterized protein n=1 Tax=Wallemia mellicola (strain ATCC MYA-4683 / CBS 633.66) TaxID=671144 RepID=I4Y956_WALMC|nr:hypothetical protein WALSEDRAFT_39936 [Wallemia mellicola CBS 633.66]EIM20498.1 hypothetical protein WALSEDRAFT_39936 [Wallemia mellicola CBS 633.66]TIC08014.1 hypothetical protein E3Q14_04081 [Wallemia mellicola]|eukprot:XP_006959524.1 hypothetical protein WALSEDRAFT_39936 [Wallemia mellicola CBS 633.66]
MINLVARRNLKNISKSLSVRTYATRPSSATTGDEVDPQLGGYPQFVPQKAIERSPFNKYWDQQGRANFGDTLHEDEDVLGIHAPDVHQYSYAESAKSILYTALAFAAFGYVASGLVPERNVAPRDYPRDGLKEELSGLEENKANEYTEAE